MTRHAYFGGGCFWCTEAGFQMVKGVVSVASGYAGGTTTKPTYKEVSSGTTAHAEVVRVEYNPEEISYEDLLTVFFAIHDPTTRNRQGADIGTQYRSIILCESAEDKIEAEMFISVLKGDGVPVVTEVVLLKDKNDFTVAESEHLDFYMRNSDSPYCQIVINPKLQKLQEKLPKLLVE